MHDLEATIVAVSTPAGRGGLGCVRLSGRRAISIASDLFRPAGEAPEPGGSPRFGRFLDVEGRPLDHGYLVLFAEGRSFSGETTAECWVHGSTAVVDGLVEASVAAGALTAGPGEFTYRALRNGRLDLIRAEAVHDLVQARTRHQARVALAQAEGTLSRRLTPLRERLEEWIARGEAAVEFVDEAETHLPSGALTGVLTDSLSECDALLDGFRTGRLLRDGATVVIAGAPNAGKSSLFNRLLAQERAIVHERAGTTRDTLEETLSLDGIPLRLVDTAGHRDPSDPVEGEGVRRARLARDQADRILLVLDGSRESHPEELALLDDAAMADRLLVVLNKSDLPEAAERAVPAGALRVSALNGSGLDALRDRLRELLTSGCAVEDPLLTNRRHAAALEQTRSALRAASQAAADGMSEEIVLEDLKLALGHLGEMTGEFTTEDLYDKIFSTFCIGK